MKRLKVKHIVMIVITLILLLCIAYLLEFTAIGYEMTVRYRGFDEVGEGVYLDADYPEDSAGVLSVISEARLRVEGFWGDIKGRPTIIISGDGDKLTRMGLTRSPAETTNFVLGGARSYIVISPDGLGVDIVAHELTHAELYARLYTGKTLSLALVPMWFDEGLATQNDYRAIYGDDKWAAETENGKNIADFAGLKTQAQFADGDDDTRRYNYIISRHEVMTWLEKHGVDGLIALIDGVNGGRSFDELYNAG